MLPTTTDMIKDRPLPCRLTTVTSSPACERTWQRYFRIVDWTVYYLLYRYTNMCIGLNCLDFGVLAHLLSANVRLFSSYAKSFNATFTAGPTPWIICQPCFISGGLFSMHRSSRLHRLIKRLRQFIHLFTESNYLQTRKHYRICFPTVPSGKVQELEQSEFKWFKPA